MMSDSFHPEALFRWRTFRGGFLIAVVLFYSIFDRVNAFNVDLPSAVIYHGTSQSMFGFTVAEYKEDGKSWVLIGAPEAPDPVFSAEDSDYKGGTVYYCNVNENDRCNAVKFPPSRNHTGSMFLNPRPDYRNRQWLGATLTTSGANGSIIACAPRYYWYGPSKNASVAREPVGTCYYSEKGFNFIEYSPCRISTKTSFGYGRLGSCQAGFSAAISKDTNRFYLGAVGSYYWQGQVFSIHTVLKLPYAYEDHEIIFDDTGRLMSRTIFGRAEFMATEEGPKTADDSYMGYAVTTLDYYGTRISGAAVGVPRADRLRGKVRLFTWNMINFKNLTGEQFAAYFGYSICTADVDGDGADDLIIGAPMYSDFKSLKNEYETGRIYVYYQGNAVCSQLNSTCGDNKFGKFDFIDGEHSKGRFGLAVTSLGDINQDGFGDFAVSAPYEGSFDDCRKASYTGAVYIYHGGKGGIRKKYSQVIRAEDVYLLSQGSSLTTFGYSLSGGQDLDNNLYPDLVVGAYESDVVYLFRSKPVIQLDADFKFLSEKKVIGLDEYRCSLKTNIWVPCVVLQMCLQYGGIGVENSIELLLEITLDSKNNRNSRMFFLEREGERSFRDQVPLYKGTTLCRNMTTYIARLAPNQDKLTPFEAQLKYRLVESSHRRPSGLPSVLNMDDETPLTRKDSMNIKNNCGENNVCIPDLRMLINSNVDQYVLGSGHLVFNVSVVNEGQDSFGSNFKLKIPPGINYSKFEVTKTENDVYVQCYAPTFYNNYTIYCDVGNPLPKGNMVNFSIVLDPNNEVEESRFEFWAAVNSTNAEFSNTTANNEKLFGIQIVEETSLTIVSTSSPKDIYYNISQYEGETIGTDKEAGPFLKHEYIIRNLGPSEVSEATAVFYWPLKISTGEDLLYLLSEPETKGNIECEKIGYTNYRHLELKRKYKEQEGSESWQYSSESGTSSGTSSGSFSGTSGTTYTTSQFSQNTKITQNSGKTSQTSQGSVNEIQGTYNTDKFVPGSKGNEGGFQVGVVDLNQGTNVGGGLYHQTGQNTYTYEQVNGQSGGSYGQSGYQGGQSGYQGGQSGYQVGQGGYSGGVQQNTFTGVQTGYNEVSQSSQTTHTGGVQSGQSGFNGLSGQNTYTGGVQNGQSGYGVSQSGQSVYTGGSLSGQSGYNGVSQSGQNIYTGGVQGGYYGSFQGGSSANTFQQNYGNQQSVGGFQSGSQGNIQTGGGYQKVDQGYGMVGGNRKNINNVHESETSYVKSTNWDGNNPNTFVESKWKTNDNGIVRNGSYSTVHPGFGYETNTLNLDKKNFFTNQNEGTTYFSQGGSSSSGIDVNAISGGSVRKVYDANTGTWITNIDEGVHISDPDVKRRFNESGNIYHYKSENTQFVQPTRVSGGPVSFIPDTLSRNAAVKIHKNRDKIPLRSNSRDYTNDDDEMENDEDDAEEDDYDEEEPKKPPHRRTRQAENGFGNNHLCSSAECVKIQCYIKRLSRDQEVSVTFPSIVWVKTIQKIALFRPVVIGSYVEVNITKLPHIRAQVSNVTYVSEVLTNVTSLDFGKTPPDVIPLWIVVGSTCLGALILMLLIYLLYKSGFFKRNRPPTMPERQPLNRNGQYHLGDEAL